MEKTLEANAGQAWQKQGYREVYTGHPGLASHKWSHYLFIYDQILERELDAGKPLTVLEIGVQNGGSLEIWKKYLPPGTEIHGMDIHPKCLTLNFSPGIRFHPGSATDIDLVNRLFADTEFDIIIDDGSHFSADVISSFINLFKKLKPGGVYVVEDLHASYLKTHHGGLARAGSSVEFFKRFIDTLHFSYIDPDELSAVPDPTPFLSLYRQEIASIGFYDSICAIRKFSRPKDADFSTLLSGKIFQVVGDDRALHWEQNLDAINTAKALYAPPQEVPPPSASAAHTRTEALLSRGIEAFNLDCFEQASAIFSELLYRSPDDPLPAAWLAFTCARQGLDDGARDFIAHALRIAPERADLLAALGEILLGADRPEQAATYLQEAVSAQPDLWAAYPALARSLHLSGRGAEAVALLDGAVRVSSAAQAKIQHTLISILAERGDLAGFTRASLRFANAQNEFLLAARCLARFEPEGEQLLTIVEGVRHQIARLPSLPPAAPSLPRAQAPLRIAFLSSDLLNEAVTNKLGSLLRYLPAADFVIGLFINDPRINNKTGGNDACNACLLLADFTVLIADGSDSKVLTSIAQIAPDVLIDLDGPGPEERLAPFALAQVPCKLGWGEATLPPLVTESRGVAGELLGVQDELPCLTLPGLGEVIELPELPLGGRPAHPVFACLSPAIRVSAEGWQLFAAVLEAVPDSTLLINLKNLGVPATAFISEQFGQAGISPDRLRFVHAESSAALCELWREADLGLAPPVDAGELALPTGLWMGRPYLALRTALPWSRRPAAWLEALGAEQWIAETPADYVALAQQFMANRPATADPTLRARIKELKLNDPAAFAQGFADALRRLLQEQEEQA
ncbi:hypothetical protein AGMMS49960_00770 [Betaproteobacteria bacterium]|nr:hypothetical protein AGMMS49543_06890 [Betaproteobacteria bacterium]GHT98185.1 hypothetical protein AGMMS49960_00770 [Betaproteobacteria bacterium]GHU21186.1 hypothetical protein AGMMS50243_18210 [Betaproteobacteria bacterium]